MSRLLCHNNMAKEIEVLKAQFVQRDYEISMNVEFPDQRNNAEKKVAALQKEQKFFLLAKI